jgi:hypothetical protein
MEILYLNLIIRLCQFLVEHGQKSPYIGDNTYYLGTAPICQFGYGSWVNVHTDTLHMGGKNVSGGYGVKHGGDHDHHIHIPNILAHFILGQEYIGDDIW